VTERDEARRGLEAGEFPGALLHARVARPVYGAPDPKAGAAEALYRLLDDARLNHRVATRSGVLGEESARLLRMFFNTRR
jgi:tRNA(adenine34) deaminase